MDPVQFANLTFTGLRREDLLRDASRLKLIITVNAEAIVGANVDSTYARIINENYATLDGHWPYVLARLRSGRRDIEKISGSDFIYELCAMAASRDLRVFLLGASAEVNERAQQKLRELYGVAIAGHSPDVHPFPFPPAVDSEILEAIRTYKPSVLITALGAPKQEFWLDQHRHELEALGVRWALNGGGSLDFVSGAVRRAPVIVQKLGLESLWRLALQPKLRIFRILKAIRFLQYA